MILRTISNRVTVGVQTLKIWKSPHKKWIKGGNHLRTNLVLPSDLIAIHRQRMKCTMIPLISGSVIFVLQSNNIEMTENEYMIRNVAYDLVDLFDFAWLVTESYHIHILITPKLWNNSVLQWNIWVPGSLLN